jgi:hypothetical protein
LRDFFSTPNKPLLDICAERFIDPAHASGCRLIIESSISKNQFQRTNFKRSEKPKHWLQRKEGMSTIPSQKQTRSVVVTGVGLVSPLGVGTEETWQRIVKGRSGIAPVTLFSTEGYACRFAGEVKSFVPENFVEKKDVKKMGRFIQFAMAASQFAMDQAALGITPENAERVGVYVGSGIGASK